MAKIDEKQTVDEILQEERENELGMRFDRLYARLSDIKAEEHNLWGVFMASWRKMSISEHVIMIESLEALRNERKTIERLLEKMHEQNPEWKPF